MTGGRAAVERETLRLLRKKKLAAEVHLRVTAAQSLMTHPIDA